MLPNSWILLLLFLLWGFLQQENDGTRSPDGHVLSWTSWPKAQRNTILICLPLSKLRHTPSQEKRLACDLWTHGVLRFIFIVSHVERFEVVWVVNHKHGNLTTVLHQILFMFRLEVTAPLQRQQKAPGILFWSILPVARDTVKSLHRRDTQLWTTCNQAQQLLTQATGKICRQSFTSFKAEQGNENNMV